MLPCPAVIAVPPGPTPDGVDEQFHRSVNTTNGPTPIDDEPRKGQPADPGVNLRRPATSGDDA